MSQVRASEAGGEFEFLSSIAREERTEPETDTFGFGPNVSPLVITSSTEFLVNNSVAAPETPSDATTAVLIGVCCFLMLVLAAFLYWIYRIELERSSVRLPTRRFVLTRRKFENSSEQTPFRGMFGSIAHPSKYDSIPHQREVPDQNCTKATMDRTAASQGGERMDFLELPSCSHSNSFGTASSSSSILADKRLQREQKIQKRNLLFDKLLSAEDDFEVFVVHEEKF